MSCAQYPTILVIGKNGQIGWELCRSCASLGTIVAMDYPEIDLETPESICDAIRDIKPTIIINAAAYTAVDKAESEPEKAMAINGIAPGILAEQAKKHGSVLIHYSTDYVYDGSKMGLYVEKDGPAPLSVYGRTKLAGDEAIASVNIPHLILRTSWVYGWRGKNFLMTILKLAREREELLVVDDQLGAPTWSRYIADATAQVIAQLKRDLRDIIRGVTGVYNVSCVGETTWYDFAKAILHADPSSFEHSFKKLSAISTDQYPTQALRPKMSLLDGAKFFKTFNLHLPLWSEPLRLWSEREN